jgi:hypothetical protein
MQKACHFLRLSSKSRSSEEHAGKRIVGRPIHLALVYAVPTIKIASPMLDTGVFKFAALKGEMDMET